MKVRLSYTLRGQRISSYYSYPDGNFGENLILSIKNLFEYRQEPRVEFYD